MVTSKPPQAKTLQVITACRIKPITQIGWVIWTESDHDHIALQLTNQMCMLWLTATQGDWHCFLIHFIFGTQLEHGSRRLSALSGSRQSFGGKQKDNCKQSVVACRTMSLCLKISQPTKNKNYADNAQLISSICLLNWNNWTTYHLEMMPWGKTSHPRVQAIILDDTHKERAIIVDMGRLASTCWTFFSRPNQEKMEVKTSWMRRAFAGTPESKWDAFCRFCRFAFANHSDVRFFHYFGTSRFTTRTEDHWRSRFLQSRCRRILTHLQIIQSPSSQCSSSSQELQRESPPRPVGTEQAQRICQQVKSASFKDFGRPGLPIFLRSPFAFHFLCQFSSLLLPFVFDLIQEFPFCSERLGLFGVEPIRTARRNWSSLKVWSGWSLWKSSWLISTARFFFESFLPPAPPRQMMQPPSPRTIFHDGTRHCHMTSHLQVISSFTAVSW